MVQQMVDKFSQYKLVSGGSTMPAGDKQQPFSSKKVALRELPNESRNIIPNPPGASSLPKDKGVSPDSIKILGTKRLQHDGPSSPSNIQPPGSGNTGTNGHLVYVRRKLENDQGKITTCLNMESTDSPESRRGVKEEIKEQNVQQDQMNEPKDTPPLYVSPTVASPAASSGEPLAPHSLGKPVTGFGVPEAHDSMVATEASLLADPQRPGNQDWKERFVRLQMFLKSCDQSSQEDYIQMLRSLSAVGRSKHAVDLEKRAIHLLLEEGKELHRMKVLNVLGKASANDYSSVSTQTPSSLQTQFQR
ncbi:uncharacterized protein [Typha latifolia]|uniref:uncharacterized protein n=1 Tax=Typha latifolia TaxID=4733 RepID=UPI003C2AC37D